METNYIAVSQPGVSQQVKYDVGLIITPIRELAWVTPESARRPSYSGESDRHCGGFRVLQGSLL
jgi:hypothetical protein